MQETNELNDMVMSRDPGHDPTVGTGMPALPPFPTLGENDELVEEPGDKPGPCRVTSQSTLKSSKRCSL
ncbi:putative serine/threonine-protein kinase kinX isoform X1 [Clarias magur]|uniref:Putative serine/threonine-protein kinase kinX isoform X1 n=1 Tax=Clarias magur TaxID=1594786 RepID=A0A8J4UQJ8_CLAMG|nr:putative serine/threonine-protein kinase kinX isoform X1 [Clarias magur]